MKQIKLTQGQYALVDDEDFDELNQYKWHAYYDPNTKSYRAITSISMHRKIMNTPRGMQTDHINHNTLDNRKQNLRICTHRQNQYNRVKHKNTTSKYKGVYLAKQKYKDKIYRYWMAYIFFNGKSINLGHFKTEIQAAHAYDKQAKELFGKFALLNFKVVE